MLELSLVIKNQFKLIFFARKFTNNLDIKKDMHFLSFVCWKLINKLTRNLKELSANNI